MDVLRDILRVNKITIKKTIKSIKKNWPLYFTGFIYTVLNIIIYSLMRFIFIGPFRIIAGFLTAIISSAFISNYIYLLFNIINYNRMTWKNFRDGFTYYLSKVYGVFFIAYIVRVIFTLITSGMDYRLETLTNLISMSIFVIFNALPETLYLKSFNPIESINYSAEFMKENWINWLIPNIIFIMLIFIFTNELFGTIFSTHIKFKSLISIRSLIDNLIAQFIFTLGMIYRGHLYKLLSSGSRRKREFMDQF